MYGIVRYQGNPQSRKTFAETRTRNRRSAYRVLLSRYRDSKSVRSSRYHRDVRGEHPDRQADRLRPGDARCDLRRHYNGQTGLHGRDQIPAFEVDLVDHAGSGDAFAGALAAYCAVENDVRAAVKFASAAGALACTKFGTLEALPTKAEIIELLQKEDTE